MALLTNEGRLVELNASAQALLGLTPEAYQARLDARATSGLTRLDGTPMTLAQHPVYRALLGRERVINEVVAFQTPHRGRRIIRVTAVPLAEHGVVITFSDVTDEHAQQEALHAERALLANIIETMPIGVFIADAEGRLLHVNRATRAIWGEDAPLLRGPEEYGRYRAWDARTGAPIGSADWALARALRSGEPVVEQEALIEGFDGKRRHILNSAIPVRDPDGRIHRYVVLNVDITERAEAEAQRQAIFDAALDAIVTVDGSGAILSWNDAAASMFGFTKEEALGKDLGALIVPERLREQHRAGLRRVAESGVSHLLGQRYRLPALRRDGSEFPAEISIVRIPGPRVQFTGFVRDLSGEAASRERALVAEERYAAVVEHIKEYAIFQLSLDGIVTSWNEGCRAIKGYAREEFIGLPFARLFPEDARARGEPEALLREARERGHAHRQGWRLRKDGTLFYGDLDLTLVRDTSGEPIGFVKVTRDITHRRADSEAAERYRLLVEGVKDYAIFMLDPEGRIVSWNSGAQRLKGYEEREILGRHFSVFYTAEDRARDHPANELAHAREHGSYGEEGWRLRKDGSRFWANVLITALWDEDGELRGYAKVTRDVTERRAAESRAEATAALTSGILASMREGLVAFGPDGHVLFANKAAEDVLGVRLADHAAAKRPADLPVQFYDARGAPLDPWRTPIALALAERRAIVDTRIQIHHPSKGRRWLNVTALPIGSGGVVASAADVTEEVSRAARREEVARIEQAVLQGQHDLSEGYVVTHRGKMVDANDAFCALTGYSREQLRALPTLYDLVDPEARERVRSSMRPNERGEVSGAFREVPWIRRDGRRIIVEGTVRVLDHAEGGPRHVTIVRDVTASVEARKRAEALAEATRRLSQSLHLKDVLAAMDDLLIPRHGDYAVVLERRSGGEFHAIHIHAVEARMEELVRLASVEFVQAPVSAEHPIHRAFDTMETSVAIHLGSPGAYERIASGPEHLALLRELHPTSILVIPLVTRGRADRVLLLGSTRPDLRHREEDVPFYEDLARRCSLALENAQLYELADRARDALEERVKERTRELEIAVRDLETFTNSASHDLRAPLRGVNALSTDLKEALRAGDAEEAQKPAQLIEQQSARASQLVSDLLAFAKSRRQDLQPQLVDVSALAREVIEDIRRRHGDRGTAWEVQPDVRAYADPGLLRIALDNLLSNAAKYSAKTAHPRVAISASADATGTTLAVRDNGVGFPQHEAHRLFAPFPRISTSDGYEGTGLGLTTVHRIVMRHGGRIWAESAPGDGTTFRILLPHALPG